MGEAAVECMKLELDQSGGALTLRLQGDWTIADANDIDRELQSIASQSAQSQIRIDCSQLKSMDLAAAWLIKKRLESLEGGGSKIEFQGQRPTHFKFIDEMKEAAPQDAALATPANEPLRAAMISVGKFWVEQNERLRSALEFYGRVLLHTLAAFGSWKRLRPASVARHVYETGVQAIPIVALIAFLITLVIAYIGAQQLEDFGAEIYTVNLVTVGVLREMGVLLTAIIVAGRSGSAFAAEIGVMKLNDEVDALKSIGMNPYEVLVVPRVLGLVIALPLLTILADAMGLAGGALLCSWLLDISFPQFIARMQDSLAPTTFWAGFLKAPAFAFLIAMTGTYRGMQVRDSSRELGRLTTVAVVQSIFLVIFANAIFAIIYLQIEF
jgi:phospholipid/cholesterol/gamma-HCH transport system permease protein